ncbi:uncharacterized protein ISCGN_014059 [Ixodes scapularis]
MLEQTVKGRCCTVVDPSNQDVRVKTHWLLFSVTDDEINTALVVTVTEVAGEKRRVNGCASVGPMTRTAVLRLKRGATTDDVSLQLRGAAEMALVVVPGSAHLFLQCNRTGDIQIMLALLFPCANSKGAGTATLLMVTFQMWQLSQKLLHGSPPLRMPATVDYCPGNVTGLSGNFNETSLTEEHE